MRTRDVFRQCLIGAAGGFGYGVTSVRVISWLDQIS